MIGGRTTGGGTGGSTQIRGPNGIVYPGQPYPSAVAVTGGRGGLLATGTETTSPSVGVFPIGRPQAIFTAAAGNAAPHGLALAANGSAVFAATVDFPYEMRLVGLHGSLTPVEMRIPILVD